MILEKHLTIKEARNEIEKLENELELYLNKKKINYNKTQPGSIGFKEIMSSGGIPIDRFTHYLIKDEEYDDKIYYLQESINSYNSYIIKEMKRITKTQPHKIQIYCLREDTDYIKQHGRKRPFLEIGEMLGYSERQVQRIYKGVINGKV